MQDDAIASLKYRRVLLKVSGEFLGGEQNNIDPHRVNALAQHIMTLTQLKVQVAVVLGAGNLCRGQLFAKQAGFDQVTADHMGMIATVMNALALTEVLKHASQPVALRSALAIEGIVAPFMREEALALLDTNHVVICAGGTGNPLVTTDTAAALRAIELRADILLKATKVDGVYSADPMRHADAKLFSHLSFDEVITKQLKVMDLAAFSLLKDHALPIRIFNMDKPHVFKNIILGEEEGTLIYC